VGSQVNSTAQEVSLQRADEGWLPIDNPPVGLITWYGPGGVAVALAMSWLGVINSHPPELHAGCCGRIPGAELFPAGADFAVNILAGIEMPMPDSLTQRKLSGCPLLVEAGLEFLPAHSVRAPLLAGCALQVECAHGRSLTCEWEPALAGDILLLHRSGVVLDPADYPDFCAIQPFRRVLNA
jgi:hypothetical protein